VERRQAAGNPFPSTPGRPRPGRASRQRHRARLRSQLFRGCCTCARRCS